jgi:phosphonate transport system permease protein
MTRPVLRTQGIDFRYSGHKSDFCLRSGPFQIMPGETIAVMGPSGGGKSTLLRILSGSLKISESVLESEKAALIYQDLRLVPEKTALENVLMGSLSALPWYRNTYTKEAEVEARNLLSALGLKEHLHQLVATLSGGQKQRVAIARALMSHPKLLLADEPFSHLDHSTALETYRLLKTLQNQKQFAIVITIHASEISDLHFERVWEVHQGQLFLNAQHQDNHIRGDVNKVSLLASLWPKLFLVSLLFLTVVSLSTLSTAGFSSTGALAELLDFMAKIFVHSPSDLAKVDWGFLFARMTVTLQMAILATSLSFVLALPLGLLSTEGVSRGFLFFPIRSFLMLLRSIPALIWALFFVAGLGLGAVAGVAALTLYSVGYLSKFIYEGIEDADRKAFDALRSLGASRWQALYQGVLPSAKPALIANFVFMLEYNVRSASLLGLVGAGGIGQDLIYAVEWRDHTRVFAILILLISTVILFDLLSVGIRKQLRKLRGT